MRKKHNVSMVKNCSGCGCCYNICPQTAIKWKLNKYGFYGIDVDTKKCNNCGLCLKFCQQCLNKMEGKDLLNSKPYSYVSDDQYVLGSASSGGFVTDLSIELLRHGYSVVGATMDYEQLIAKAHMIDNVEDVISLAGSKYLQTFTFDTYQLFKNDKKMLVIGLPCQIAGFQKYLKFKKIGQENIIFVELFCFGVPSYELFHKYLNSKLKNREVKRINFRSKKYGYHSYTFEFELCDGTVLYSDQLKDNDEFYSFFKSRLFLNQSCYSCKFRKQSLADIRVGDVWGDVRFLENKTGATAIYSLTAKGDKIMKLFSDSGHSLIDGNLSGLNYQFNKENKSFKSWFWYPLLKTNFKLSHFALRCSDKIKEVFKR